MGPCSQAESSRFFSKTSRETETYHGETLGLVMSSVTWVLYCATATSFSQKREAGGMKTH